MAKKTVDNDVVIEMLLNELKSVRAELNALKASGASSASGDSSASSAPKAKTTQPKKKLLEDIKKLEKELIELDAQYWAIMDKRSIVAGRLADLYSELGEKREKSYYDFPTSRQIFTVAKLAQKVDIPLLGMLYKGQLSQVIDLTKRAGDDAAKKKLAEYLDELQAR